MATKSRVRITKTKIVEDVSPEAELPTWQPKESFPPEVNTNRRGMKWVVIAVIALGLLVTYWWKTNSWPVMAMVGMKPVTRMEVMNSLYKQGGASVLENLITQRIIETELDKENVQIDAKEVDDQINKAKASLPAGTTFEAELAKQGLTLPAVRNLISLQLRLTKVTSTRVVVTDSEIADFIKTNGQYLSATSEAGKATEARTALAQQNQDSAIQKWIDAAKAKVKVWKAPGI